MPETISWKKLSQTRAIAARILKASGNKIALYGELGAGKTTLIKEMCKILGYKDATDSPTFSILNIYDSGKESGKDIYHFDFYRIKSMDEAFELGIEEYIYSDNYVFVEWPEKIEELLTESFTKIRIRILNDNSRTLEFF